MGNSKEKKNKGKSINAFIIVFGVIVACYILSFFISPGAFEREVVGGRTIVVPNSFHAIEKTYLGLQAIFQAIPNGLEASAGMMFLVMLVAGCIEVYKRTNTLDKSVAKILTSAEKVGSEKILVLIMVIFACFGGFLGWNEQIVPFIPIIISLCLALGYDLMTGVACSAMIDMISFSISPTSVYTVGISHEIAELPMFSGFLFRFILMVSGICSSLKADDDIGLLCEHVRNLTFSLISPVCSNYCFDHNTISSSCRSLISLYINFCGYSQKFFMCVQNRLYGLCKKYLCLLFCSSYISGRLHCLFQFF